MHTKIKKYLIEQYGKYGITENYLSIRLNLNDMVSNEYAVILKDLQIGKLQLIDTCGIDHVGMGNQQELKNRLEVFPASPVYCVFIGIDIFYRTSNEIDSLNWSYVGEWQPKAVNYLLSDSGRKLLESENDGERLSIDENMYLVMRNNLLQLSLQYETGRYYELLQRE